MRTRGAIWIPLLIIGLGASGCALLNRGAIKAGGVSVTGPKDAGTPVVLNTSQAGEATIVPKDSKITITETPAVAPVPATKDEPSKPAQPAKKVTEIVPAAPMEWKRTENTVSANSGTVDTSIAAKRIDAEESRPLLYAAIAAALAAGFFVYRAYPTPALCCGAASVVFFMAWRMAGLPPWFWALGLAAVAGGAFLYLGHEKGLYTPVPDDKK